MKINKRTIKIIFIILTVVLITSFVFKYYDSARVRTSHEPKLVLKFINKDGTKITYYGLGYKIIRYPSVSPNEPYKNNKGVKMGSWFMKYKIPSSEEKLEIKKITDKTKTMFNFSCAEVLEQFYEDETYQYYYNCMKSKYIIVEYKDGSEETVKSALENNRIKISELDKYDIEYLKYEK